MREPDLKPIEEMRS